MKVIVADSRVFPLQRNQGFFSVKATRLSRTTEFIIAYAEFCALMCLFWLNIFVNWIGNPGTMLKNKQ